MPVALVYSDYSVIICAISDTKKCSVDLSAREKERSAIIYRHWFYFLFIILRLRVFLFFFFPSFFFLFFFSFLIFLRINICKYVPFVHRRSDHGESLISIEWLNTSNREETYFFIFFSFFFLRNFLQHFSVKCKNRYFIASYIFFPLHLIFFFRGFSFKTERYGVG